MEPQNLNRLTKDVSITPLEGFNQSLNGSATVLVPGAVPSDFPYSLIQGEAFVFQLRFVGLLKFKTKYMVTAGSTFKIHKRDADDGEWVEVHSATFNDDTETTEEINIVAVGYLEIRLSASGADPSTVAIVPKEFHFSSASGTDFVETTTTAPMGNPSGYSKEYISGVGFVWRPYWIA